MEDEVEAIEEPPKEPATKKRRSRWGQEPEQPPAIDPNALALVGVPLGGYGIAGAGASLALPAPPGTPASLYPSAASGYNMDLSAAAQAAREALDKAKRAAMFQRQIQEQMAKLKTQGLAAGFLPGEGPKARKLILDEFGRELDEEGNVVPMRPQVVSTLKVNINREKEARMKKILGLKKEGSSETAWFDPTLKTPMRVERAKRKTFRFIEEGSLVRKEQRLVKKIQERALGMDKEKEREKKGKKEDEKRKEDHEEDANKAEIGVRKIEPKVLRREPIPDVEWWDMPFLREDMSGQKRQYTEVNVEKITPYVEHPISIKITTEKDVPDAAMMHLTPKERKKLRRLKRQERTQEIRDKIKMGILQPPPPKVKMSNLMRVLGDEAIADPSTVERKVRQQVEQRRKEHEQRNEARKLPAEERKAKKKQKWMAETEPTTQVLVFKIRDLTNKRHLFKIDMNAQQFHLSGCCITCTGVANIVIVEGGPRATKRYKKLMIRRIKWSEDQTKDEDDGGDSDDEDNVTAPKLQDHCVLIWEGVVKQRSFKNWKVTHARSEVEARKTLADRGSVKLFLQDSDALERQITELENKLEASWSHLHIPSVDGHPQDYRLLREEDYSSWAIFFLIFTILILFDNFVLHRKNEVLSFGRALLYCCFWISCAALFCAYVYFTRGPTAAFDWWTGYMLEWMLSVDNLFVFRTVFVYFKTPDEQKHKPLFWGIVGAIIFRMAFFVVEELLLHNFTWMHFLLGIFLVYTGLKILWVDEDEGRPDENPILEKIFKVVPFVDAYAVEPKFVAKVPYDENGVPLLAPAKDCLPENKWRRQESAPQAKVVPSWDASMQEIDQVKIERWRYRATRLALVVVCLEITDVVFAVDSVSAIVAQIPDLFLAYTACVFAMLGLRATFFVIDELVNLFSLLSYAVAAILVFIGIKLCLKTWVHIPPWVVCIVLSSTLTVAMIASLVYERMKGPEAGADDTAGISDSAEQEPTKDKLEKNEKIDVQP